MAPPGRRGAGDVRPTHPQSDPHDWDELVAESAAAERYSRRLGERITDGYAREVRDPHDQAGLPPLGFPPTRGATPRPRDRPGTIGRRSNLFERYALGTISVKQLAAETGLEAMRIQKILKNPIYNGWMRRHRGPDEERRPAHGGPTHRSMTSCGHRRAGPPQEDRVVAVPGSAAVSTSSRAPRVRLRSPHPQ